MSEDLKARRLSDMAHSIAGALGSLRGAELDRAEANDALTTAKSNQVNAREQIMVTLAATAHDNDWDGADIKAACKMAATIATNAETDKAIATFLSEVQHAMHPNVREYVGNIVDVRDRAWDAETAALEVDKKAHAPLRKAFSRRYHLLVDMLKQASDDVFYATPEDLVAHAETRNPDHNPKKVLARIHNLRDQLYAASVIFPAPDLVEAIAFLNEMTEDKLAEARAALQPVAAPSPPGNPATTPQPRPTASSGHVTQPSVATVVQPKGENCDAGSALEPLPGAIDIDFVNELLDGGVNHLPHAPSATANVSSLIAA